MADRSTKSIMVGRGEDMSAGTCGSVSDGGTVGLASCAGEVMQEYGFTGTDLRCCLRNEVGRNIDVAVAAVTSGRGHVAMASHRVLLVFPRSDVVFIDDRTYLYGRLMMSDGVVSPYYVKVEYSSVLSIWEGAADASLIDCRKNRYAYSHPGALVAAQTLLEALVEDPTGVVMEGLRDGGG